jgi:hypothetical protein
MTLRKFAAKHRLAMTAELIDRNPNMPDDDWARTATHWRCVLRRGRARMTIHFSQGPAVAREPGLEDVLDSLASDAASYLNADSFESWAGDLGFDPDSRSAERTYNAIGAEVAELTRLLGEEGVRELAFETERL